MEQKHAIIVDDEASSRNVLREYLLRYCPEIKIVGEADSVQSAVAAISNLKPEILFLDIEMPQGNGFDLLEKLSGYSFEVIFTTAFEQYAIKALNFGAAHYLLKPISIDELIEAVKKVVQTTHVGLSAERQQIILDHVHTKNEKPARIVLPLLDGFEVVDVSKIIWCEANDNFTDFHFSDRNKMMICRTLKFYEELLHESGFLRVHKSYMVNCDHVVRYNKGKGGVITMSDQAEVPLSVQKKDEFLSRFTHGRG